MAPEDTPAAVPAAEPTPAEAVEEPKSDAPAESPSEAAAAPAEASTSATASGEQVSFKVAYGKAVQDCKRPFESTVGDLKVRVPVEAVVLEAHAGRPERTGRTMHWARLCACVPD